MACRQAGWNLTLLNLGATAFKAERSRLGWSASAVAGDAGQLSKSEARLQAEAAPPAVAARGAGGGLGGGCGGADGGGGGLGEFEDDGWGQDGGWGWGDEGRAEGSDGERAAAEEEDDWAALRQCAEPPPAPPRQSTEPQPLAPAGSGGSAQKRRSVGPAATAAEPSQGPRVSSGGGTPRGRGRQRQRTLDSFLRR